MTWANRSTTLATTAQPQGKDKKPSLPSRPTAPRQRYPAHTITVTVTEVAPGSAAVRGLMGGSLGARRQGPLTLGACGTRQEARWPGQTRGRAGLLRPLPPAFPISPQAHSEECQGAHGSRRDVGRGCRNLRQRGQADRDMTSRGHLPLGLTYH